MLVITRKKGQKIIIPECGIEISLCKVLPDGRARIGIEAPREVSIKREEAKPVAVSTGGTRWVQK